MAKTENQEFAASPGRVFSACKHAVALLGYTVISSDESGRMIAFNTGRSMRTWAGQDLQATVLAYGKGSRVVVGGTIARRGGIASAQQIAWGEKAALSNTFLIKVAELLPSIPESAITRSPVVSGAPPLNRMGQLEKASELRDKGLLTEEEFQAEKSRILNS